jgi:hypothetical protein
MLQRTAENSQNDWVNLAQPNHWSIEEDSGRTAPD